MNPVDEGGVLPAPGVGTFCEREGCVLKSGIWAIEIALIERKGSVVAGGKGGLLLSGRSIRNIFCARLQPFAEGLGIFLSLFFSFLGGGKFIR